MTKRISYYDSLRGIAIIGVVIIHSIQYTSDYFQIAVSLRQITNFAVPLFLALSGFFLVNKEVQDIKEYKLFLKKQTKRVYFPYLFWSAMFLIYNVFLLNNTSLSEMLGKILIFQSSPIYYYIAVIIQCYLLLPIFQKYLKRLILPSIIISFIMCVSVFLYEYLSHQKLPLIIYAGNILTWGMFFVLGAYLGTHRIKIKNNVLIILIILSLGLSIFETHIQNYFLNDIHLAVSAVKISSFIYSGLLIIFLLNNKFNLNLFSKIGKSSYAVYLMHLLILPSTSYFLKLCFTSYFDGFFISMIAAIATLIICYLFCKTIKQIIPNLSSKWLGV